MHEDEKDEINIEVEPLTAEDMKDVVGGRPGGKPTTTTANFAADFIDGVNNDTLFAGSGDDSKFNLGMPGKKR